MRGKVRKARNRGDGMWMQEVWGVKVVRASEAEGRKWRAEGLRRIGDEGAGVAEASR
jgi:hypothetical protein